MVKLRLTKNMYLSVLNSRILIKLDLILYHTDKKKFLSQNVLNSPGLDLNLQLTCHTLYVSPLIGSAHLLRWPAADPGLLLLGAVG